MNYDLCKKLKDAGFKQTSGHLLTPDGQLDLVMSVEEAKNFGDNWASVPTLSELIEAIEPYAIKLEKRYENRPPEGYLKFSIASLYSI